VIPDRKVEEALLIIFGSQSFPMRKMRRMLYWMPKFKNLSPWPLPDPLPASSMELAMLAIKRIMSVDPQADVNVYNVICFPLLPLRSMQLVDSCKFFLLL